MLGKKKKTRDVSDGANKHERIAQYKRFALLALIVVCVLALLLLFGTGGEKKASPSDVGASERLQGAASRNPSDKESFESLSRQVQGQAGAVDAANKKVSEFRTEIGELRDLIIKRNNEDVSGVEGEVAYLKSQIALLNKKISNLSSGSTQGASIPGRSSDGGRGQNQRILPPTTQGRFNVPEPVSGVKSTREVVILELGGSDNTELDILDDVEKNISGNLSDAVEPDVFATDDYVPPNAFAPATVLVGVDAATGQRAQNDPLNATFLITGPARHVVKNGVMEQTDLEGCVVNGAAFGDLSSERILIKLAKMTCPLPNGQVAVQDVQGHVTENGKAGVRGKIISRVGDKINRAAVAGLFSGLGGALGNSGRGFGGGGSGGIIQEIPNGEELAIASVGAGVSNAASTLTEYYVERARAIEPVVSMPRGIDVELVFISGFKPRPTVESE